MVDRISPPSDRITVQAFREFNAWTDAFSRRVRERAGTLAAAARTPGMITSEILVQAVHSACGELVAELTGTRG